MSYLECCSTQQRQPSVIGQSNYNYSDKDRNILPQSRCLVTSNFRVNILLFIMENGKFVLHHDCKYLFYSIAS